MAAGAAAISLRDPRRGDMVALLGDLTSGEALVRLRDRLASDPNGDGWGPKLLKEKPRLTSSKVAEWKLSEFPVDTFGYAWHTYLDRHGFDPDSRAEVRYIDDPELRWVLQRYREVHDLWHVLLGIEPSVEGELALKWIEMHQTGLPMPALAAIVGPLRLVFEDSPLSLIRFVTTHIPWASRTAENAVDLMAVPYEQLLPEPIAQVRRQLRLQPFS